MNSENSSKETAVKLDGDKTGSQNSRRRWLKITGMAAPGLLMLASRPALAQTCSISGFMSAKVGTSLTNYDPVSCGGWSPGAWKNNNGAVTDTAWGIAGVSRGTSFDSVFNTSNTTIALVKLTGGVVDGPQNYTSAFTNTFQQIIEGILSGANNLKSITKHAAAAYLNASFVANGGGGANPPAWMLSYMSPEEVVALYLLYEISILVAQPANVTFQLQRGGVVIADSTSFTSADYKAHFSGIANEGAP
jgi:hypothetical protein